jgi:hydroxylaminobenzene mutase
MKTNAQAVQADKLIFFGILLFLIGLTAGLIVHNMANPRMALSAHLEGVMNGMFLVILGLIWKRLMLSDILLKTAYRLVIYGSFANFIAVMLAALTGFGKMMPIAGGKDGKGFTESVISFLLVTLSISMLAVCIIVLIGFYKKMKYNNQIE